MKFSRFLQPGSLELLNLRVKIKAEGCPHCRCPSAVVAHGYDGWNLIAEYGGVQSNDETFFFLQATHTWGIDLSGTLQGAGGVGGLLSSSLSDDGFYSSQSYFPAYDGNGNVTAWVNGSGTLIARMDYSPFGQLIAQYKFTQPNDNTLSRLPFGFSTKYTDKETGHLYYGKRYYGVMDGRWLSKDPIEEEGGLNLYGFVRNNSCDLVDALGEKWMVLGRARVSSINTVETDGIGGIRVYLRTQDSVCGYFAALMHEMVHLTEALAQDASIGKIKPATVTRNGTDYQLYFERDAANKLVGRGYDISKPNWKPAVQVDNTDLQELYKSEKSAYQKQQTAVTNLRAWLKDENATSIDPLLKEPRKNKLDKVVKMS